MDMKTNDTKIIILLSFTSIAKCIKKTTMKMCVKFKDSFIDCFHDPIMQYVLGGSLHKNNTIYFLLGLDHASGN